MTRFAANLSMLFTEVRLIERFGRAAAAGFDAVELQFPYELGAQAIAAELRAHALTLVLHNLPAGDFAAGERGIACLPGREAEFRAGVESAIAYATVLGVRQLNCLAGKAPPGVAPDQLQATLLANLRHAAQRLHEAGLRLLIEPINQRDVPGFFVHTTAQAVALIEALAQDGADGPAVDNVFVQYDAYHAQRSEGELAGTIERHLARIGHIQIADNPGRHEPGSGEINHGFLFAHLKRIGYAGDIGCEYIPAGRTEDGLGWLAAARAVFSR